MDVRHIFFTYFLRTRKENICAIEFFLLDSVFQSVQGRMCIHQGAAPEVWTEAGSAAGDVQQHYLLLTIPPFSLCLLSQVTELHLLHSHMWEPFWHLWNCLKMTACESNIFCCYCSLNHCVQVNGY